jgi:hypothetical protein
MIRTPTVFVVGAGASCELGFPAGAALLRDIATALDIRFDYDRMASGDSRIFDAFEQLARNPDGRRGNVNTYLHTSWRIRDAAQLGLSIDNIINQLDNDPLVPACGKLGIARQLLLAEKESIIRINRDDPSAFPLSEVRSTWLGRFAQLISQDMQASALDRIFGNVSIVSFNYDRSIRRTLPYVLASQFAIGEEAAQALSRQLKIFYPYGSLGGLPWEVGYQDGVGYGEADTASLVKVASTLRTFTEQIEDTGQLAEMRNALSSAERLVFLGFGYHRQNLDLLTAGVRPDAKRIYGTSLGLSASDTEVVRNQLSFFYRDRTRRDVVLLPEKCVTFMDEHFRTFVS